MKLWFGVVLAFLWLGALSEQSKPKRGTKCRDTVGCMMRYIRKLQESLQNAKDKITELSNNCCACQANDTLDMPCTFGSDCSSTQCCVSDTRPIGKRSDSVGHCKLMGTSGSSCLVNQGSGKSDETAFVSCPCSTGLQCIGSGSQDIPLGEIGTCQ